MTACFLHCFLCHDYRQCQMTVIEVKENGAIRTKMLSCDSPFFVSLRARQDFGAGANGI